MSSDNLPHGYGQTLDCLNQPDSWDVPGMIADMAEFLRNDMEVPPGQLLAAIDWMTFRLKEARSILVAADLELRKSQYGWNIDEADRISGEASTLCEKLKGY